MESAIEAELAWLNGERDEPSWPPFEREPAHPRHRFGRLERVTEHEDRKPEFYTDHQAAALWLGKAAEVFDAKKPWLRDVAEAYSPWTSVANGSELDESEDVDTTPHEWNEAYFKLLAHCLPGLTIAQVEETALGMILGLPDEAFLDVMTIFLRSVDAVYFGDLGLQETQAVHVRTALARRLMETRDWKWQSRDRSTSISARLARRSQSFSSMIMRPWCQRSATCLKRESTVWVPFCLSSAKLCSGGHFYSSR